MYYSDELIEEIRSRNDIVDVVSSYVKLQKKGSTYFGLCPFHSEKSPSFSVTPSKQMYYCFGCGAGGNAYTFIMKYENYSFTEAVKDLANRAGIELPEVSSSPEEKRRADLKARLLEVNKNAATFYYRMLKSERGAQGYEYLKNRGLSDDTITRFGLGYSSNYANELYEFLRGKGFEDSVLKESGLFNYSEKKVYDKFTGRVMFPIMDVNNRVIGFGGRVMGDGGPKYLNSPETLLFDKSRNLYGLNIARNSRKDHMLICEGYMDVISMHQAGFNNTVASLGTAYTVRQASLIKRYVDKVYLTYDSDGAGVKAALRAIPISKEAGLSVKVIDMKPYKDPDEFIKNLGADAYTDRISNARNAFLYEIDKMREETNLEDPDMKAKFFQNIAKKLIDIKDELERNVYIDTVCDEYMIQKDSLLRTISNLSLTITEEELKAMDEEEAVARKKSRDDGITMALKTLLTWLIDDPTIYAKIYKYISTDDFITPLYHQVAELLFAQLDNGSINPAAIINRFDNEQEQSEVAGLFSSPVREELTKDEREKTLNDIVHNVKKNSIDYRSKNVTDIMVLQSIIKEQNDLKNLHITL